MGEEAGGSEKPENVMLDDVSGNRGSCLGTAETKDCPAVKNFVTEV